MRRFTRAFALCLLLCAAFAVQAGAFDAAAQTVQDERTLRSAVSGDAQDYLAGTDGGDVTASFSRLFRNAAPDAERAWQSALGSMTAAAGIIILTALLRGFSHAAGGAADEAVDLAGVLGVSAVLLQDFSGVLSLCRSALDGIGVFSAALQPVLAAALSMGGNAVTATALQAATMLVFDLVLRLTESRIISAHSPHTRQQLLGMFKTHLQFRRSHISQLATTHLFYFRHTLYFFTVSKYKLLFIRKKFVKFESFPGEAFQILRIFDSVLQNEPRHFTTGHLDIDHYRS